MSFFRTFAFTGALIAGLMAAPIAGFAPAEAAMCGSHSSMTNLLSERYKEAPIGVGMVSDRGVMQVYVSPDSATWSIVVTTPHGRTCIIAAGQNYEGLKVTAKGPSA